MIDYQRTIIVKRIDARLVEFLERNRTDYPEDVVKGLLFDIGVLQKVLALHR